MFTPSTPFAFTCCTVAVTVASACASPAHMFGLLAEKSCRITVSTTFVPCLWASATMFVRFAEFHVLQPLSLANWPAVFTCRPKKATVLSRSKFQLG